MSQPERDHPTAPAPPAADAALRRARWTYRGVVAGIVASALAILALALR